LRFADFDDVLTILIRQDAPIEPAGYESLVHAPRNNDVPAVKLVGFPAQAATGVSHERLHVR
jgi:hypothetical protein